MLKFKKSLKDFWKYDNFIKKIESLNVADFRKIERIKFFLIKLE